MIENTTTYEADSIIKNFTTMVSIHDNKLINNIFGDGKNTFATIGLRLFVKFCAQLKFQYEALRTINIFGSFRGK